MVHFTVYLTQSHLTKLTLFLHFRTKRDNSTSSFYDEFGNIDTSSNDFFVLVYSILIGAMFITALIRTMSFFTICMRTSVNLHNSIFGRILRTPISHFDLNPSGRILNRFSKDTGIVDENLPAVAYELQVVSFWYGLG